MKFSILYEELKFSDVFTPASPEEAEERLKKYPELQLQELVDNAKKTKLSNGSLSIHGHLDISNIDGLSSLKTLNVSRVTKSFRCEWLKLTSLEGCPKEVGGDFVIKNTYIKNLEGLPKKIGGSIVLFFNYDLTSLEGLPKSVNGYFSCCRHRMLTTLKGCPERIKGHFICRDNGLTSLEGFPKFIGDSVKLNPNNFENQPTKEEIESICIIGGEIHLNEEYYSN